MPHRKHTASTSVTKLMLFKNIITLYSEDHGKHIYAICYQNAEMFNVKVDRANRCSLKSQTLSDMELLAFWTLIIL
jgi:hypothetical protein